MKKLIMGVVCYAVVTSGALAVYWGGDFRNESQSTVWLKVGSDAAQYKPKWTECGSVSSMSTINLGDWGSTSIGTCEFQVYSDSGYSTLLGTGSGAGTSSTPYPVVYTWTGGGGQTWTNNCADFCYTNTSVYPGQFFSANVSYAWGTNLPLTTGMWLPYFSHYCVTICDTNNYELQFRVWPTLDSENGTNWIVNPNQYTSNSTPSNANPSGTPGNGGVPVPPTSMSTNSQGVGYAIGQLERIVAKETKQDSQIAQGNYETNIMRAMWEQGWTNLALISNVWQSVQSNISYQSSIIGALNSNAFTANTNAWYAQQQRSNIIGALYAPFLQMSNYLATNGYEADTNLLSGEANYMSNKLAHEWGDIANGQQYALTNAPGTTEEDRSVWDFPIYTNAGVGNAPARTTIDLNPLHSEVVAGLFAWVKFGIKFYIQFVVFFYMFYELKKAMVDVLHVPGSLSTLSNWAGFLVWARSNTMFATLMLACIVFGSGALDTFLTQLGGWYASPFSATGIAAVAGGAAKYVRAGLEVVEAIFPISYIGLACGVVFGFDLLLAGHVVFVGRLVRALS